MRVELNDSMKAQQNEPEVLRRFGIRAKLREGFVLMKVEELLALIISLEPERKAEWQAVASRRGKEELIEANLDAYLRRSYVAPTVARMAGNDPRRDV